MCAYLCVCDLCICKDEESSFQNQTGRHGSGSEERVSVNVFPLNLNVISDVHMISVFSVCVLKDQ